MPGSPQWNTRVGKRPRAFPEWRGVPAKHHTLWASCDKDLARPSPVIPTGKENRRNTARERERERERERVIGETVPLWKTEMR